MKPALGPAAVLALASVLAACAHPAPEPGPTVAATPPPPRIVTLAPPPTPELAARPAAPAAAPCKTDLGPPPAYPDTARALADAPDLFERVKLLLAARELRIARERALTDALRACGSRR